MIVQFKPSALRQTRWHEYLVRFVLGGAMTVVAGLIAARFGPVVGGLFLAFPAIFPASATLIEKHVRERKEKAGLPGARRGKEAAALDAAGAALGSFGLAAFGLVIWLMIVQSPAWALVLAVAAVLANRHPERTVFTRFIPPERPDQMPGMSRRYYTRWRVATRDYLDLFMIALPLMATFFALSFRPFARRHSQAFIIAFGLVGMACTYINVYLFAVDSPFRIDNGNATMNAMLMLGFLALLPLSVSSTIVLGSIVVAGHAGVVMEAGMLLWTSGCFIFMSALCSRSPAALPYWRERFYRTAFTAEFS